MEDIHVIVARWYGLPPGSIVTMASHLVVLLHWSDGMACHLLVLLQWLDGMACQLVVLLHGHMVWLATC